MSHDVKWFQSLPLADEPLAGGKGAVLARLFQAGFRVPPGFIILTSAFQGDKISPPAWKQAKACINSLRTQNRDAPISFAVRSSGRGEDTSRASFAGGFLSILNLKRDEEILEAILAVRRSYQSERAAAYAAAQGMPAVQEIAVIVQRMVPSDLSGVLFTSDPLRQSSLHMPGNFVSGPGEQLVSGEVDPLEFRIEKSSGSYHGPPMLQPWAAELHAMAERLEQILGGPQDTEWAIAEDQLYLLQSRPITTLAHVEDAADWWNDSLQGEFLWSNTNFGEAVSEAMTPLSWSVLRFILEDWQFMPGQHPVGNICGHPYLNISVFASLLHAVGKSRQEILEALNGMLFMQLPESIDIPLITLSRRALLSSAILALQRTYREWRGLKRLPTFLSTNPDWCRETNEAIHAADAVPALLTLWQRRIEPHIKTSVWSVLASASHLTDFTIRLRQALIKCIGPEDTDLLMITSDGEEAPGSGSLASLQPSIALSKVAAGTLSRDAYLTLYGHRCQHEFELAAPRPAEDERWLDLELARFQEQETSIPEMLDSRVQASREAWTRFTTRYPHEADRMRSRINEARHRTHMREAARSEYTRDRWVVRMFALKAGELTGLGDAVFHLLLRELLEHLAGHPAPALDEIAHRRNTLAQFQSLPALPPIICGAFDSLCWAADPDRRADIFDSCTCASGSGYEADSDQAIEGSPASAGIVEGRVRLLNRPEDGHQLQQGEILLTRQTNVAWISIFPRAAAMITDVGAPLSHAAIVARELGIPAVVGCGNATMRLKTGDFVRVDGSQGKVSLLQ